MKYQNEGINAGKERRVALISKGNAFATYTITQTSLRSQLPRSFVTSGSWGVYSVETPLLRCIRLALQWHAWRADVNKYNA